MIENRSRMYAIIFLAILFIAAVYLLVGVSHPPANKIYGATWSVTYARELGIDPQQGLEAMLDDLKITHVRIPVYWTEVEPSQGTFIWDEYDKQLDAIEKRGGKVILVLGAKQPRWPEWWIPTWVKSLDQEAQEQAQLDYVKKAYEHFSQRPSIEKWQVENESQLRFGKGTIQSKAFAEKEMDLVRGLEAARTGAKRPVVTTESGELALWFGFAGHVDGIGTSVYRVIQNKWIGIFRYQTPSIFYRRKANLVERWTGPVYVSEFQMEPWTIDLIQDTPVDEQMKTFDLKQMQKNFAYGQKLEFPEVYFWGAEWWYWMKVKQNHPEFWNAMKTFMASR